MRTHVTCSAAEGRLLIIRPKLKVGQSVVWHPQRVAQPYPKEGAALTETTPTARIQRVVCLVVPHAQPLIMGNDLRNVSAAAKASQCAGRARRVLCRAARTHWPRGPWLPTPCGAQRCPTAC